MNYSPNVPIGYFCVQDFAYDGNGSLVIKGSGKTWTVLPPNTTSEESWNFYATNWDSEPVKVANISEGEVYRYDLDDVSRYRLVPEPYDASNDAFYSSWNGDTLSDKIVSRG